MTAQHRAPAQPGGAARIATAAGAIAVTAGLTMATPQAASAAAPNYKQVITDYSSALENFLQGRDAQQSGFNSIWNPIAGLTGGILPTFTSSYDQDNLTKITDLPDGLRKIANITLPTGVPGVVPNIILPGGESVKIPLPTTLPGGELLDGAADTMDGIFDIDLDAWDPLDWFPDTGTVGDVIDRTLPALDQVLKGLKFTTAEYTDGYDWKLLGISGDTWINNTFLQTPSGLILDVSQITPTSLQWLMKVLDLDPSNLELLPEDSLPSGTVWLPMGGGNYGLPVGAELGWWAAAPTTDLALPGWLGGSDTVVSLPITAGGVRAPLGLFEAGRLSANLLLPTGNGVYSPIGVTTTNINTPIGFGFTNATITTGNYAGTNGIVYDSGQNIAILQNPLGIPIPLIYSLGGFNVGSGGIGWTAPSLFGMSLLSPIQIGEKAGPSSADGLIPPALMPTDFLNGLLDTVVPIRHLDALLGVQPVIAQVTTALGPVYQLTFGTVLRPFEELATSQYGGLVEGGAANLRRGSEIYRDVSTAIGDGLGGVGSAVPAGGAASPSVLSASFPGSTVPPASVDDDAAPRARHALADGGEPAPDLISRVIGNRDAADRQDAEVRPETGTASESESGAIVVDEPAADDAPTEDAPDDQAADEAGDPAPSDPVGETGTDAEAA